jgi:hypothetical protein
MWKKKLGFILLILMVIGLSSAASAQIVVEDASFIWEKALDSTEFPDISPRITAEYATTIFDIDLVPPPDFELPARIIVEYATAIARFDLSSLPVCEGDFNNDVDVDGSDLAVFAADFGRTDCAGDCGGDFDEDGDVDGSDLAVFAADFGRTDCPHIHKVE